MKIEKVWTNYRNDWPFLIIFSHLQLSNLRFIFLLLIFHSFLSWPSTELEVQSQFNFLFTASLIRTDSFKTCKIKGLNSHSIYLQCHQGHCKGNVLLCKICLRIHFQRESKQPQNCIERLDDLK